jgi:hypothetical protein
MAHKDAKNLFDEDGWNEIIAGFFHGLRQLKIEMRKKEWFKKAQCGCTKKH